MRKIILIAMLIFLSACQPKEVVVTPPNHEELGKICTLVTTFEDDMVNVSIYYTQNETYPIQNENELYEVNDMILRYSSSGLKNIQDYPANKEKSYEQCGITHGDAIQLATQIPTTDFLKFINQLKKYEFYYEVNKNDQSFKVLMPNDVHVMSSMNLNNERVYALDFEEKELEQFKNLQLTKEYQTIMDGKDAQISSVIVDHIQKDGSQTINPSNYLIGVGEGYQIFVSVANKEDLAVDYYPIMTLVKFSKQDIRDNTYIQLDENRLLSELNDYQLYETEDSVIYDFNRYFYQDVFTYEEVYNDILGLIK